MSSNGIRDRVAIVGMGCTPFGEHWSKSADDLLIDATTQAVASAGIPMSAVDAFNGLYALKDSCSTTQC